uniref:Uncharacterized protein n=1 Tax=Anas platyrhynchos platyrhynchos TaxID=8840 RepID=A0A493TRR8_ANAPP
MPPCAPCTSFISSALPSWALWCPVWHFLSFLEAAFRAMSVLNVQAIRSIIYRLVCEQPEMTEDFPGLPKPNPICYFRVAWTFQVESRQEHGLGEFSGECVKVTSLHSRADGRPAVKNNIPNPHAALGRGGEPRCCCKQRCGCRCQCPSPCACWQAWKADLGL